MAALHPLWSGLLYGELAGDIHFEGEADHGAVSGSLGLHRTGALTLFDCSGSFDGRRLHLSCTAPKGDSAPALELHGTVAEDGEIKGDWSAPELAGGGFVLFPVQRRPA